MIKLFESLFNFFIIHSLTVSFIAIVFLILVPLIKKEYSSKRIYYTSVIILICYIIPVSQVIKIVESFISKNNSTSTIKANNMIVNTVQSISNMTNSSNFNGIMIRDNAQKINISISAFIGCLYLIIMGLIFLYHILSHINFIRLNSRWNEMVTNQFVNGILQDTSTELDIKRKIELRQNELISGPMIIGLFNPVIVFPPNVIKDYNDELKFIIKHELIHFKRKDNWIKMLVSFISTIYWFNPIVYILAKEIALYCEISCDAEVVMNKDYIFRKQYGEAIIGVINKRKNVNSILVNNLYGGKKGMKKRMFSIMDGKNKKNGVFMSLAILSIVITLTTILTQQVFASQNTPTLDTIMTNDDLTTDYSSVTDYYRLVNDIGNKYDELYAKLDFTAEEGEMNTLLEKEQAEYNIATQVIYEPFGLEYDQATGRYTYDGELVRHFEDNLLTDGTFGGRVVNYKDGTIDVFTIRDSSGKITGIEVLDKANTKEQVDKIYNTSNISEAQSVDK